MKGVLGVLFLFPAKIDPRKLGFGVSGASLTDYSSKSSRGIITPSRRGLRGSMGSVSTDWIEENARGVTIVARLGAPGTDSLCNSGRIGDSGASVGSTCSETIVEIVNGADSASIPARLVIGVCARDDGGEGNLASLSSITTASY